MRRQARPSITTLLWLAVAGALMILPVGLAGFGVGTMTADFASSAVRNLTIALLGSALPEELARYAVLYLVAFWRKDPPRPRDALVFGAAAALGFSVAENLLYGVSLGWHMVAVKLVIATPIHLALGITMGGLLVIADSGVLVRRSIGFPLALLLPILLHGVYDMVVLNALGHMASGTPDLTRIIAPALCYAIILAYAACIGRRAYRMQAAAVEAV